MIGTMPYLDLPIVCQVQVWMVPLFFGHISNLVKEAYSCNGVQVTYS